MQIPVDKKVFLKKYLERFNTNYLAKEDLNFSCASRAARASSSSYRLQLYHELPCGSHDPRQTQQKSCLQFEFLQTFNEEKKFN